MDNCKHCSEIKSVFETVGKTYYRLESNKDIVLCYRHWYQQNKPKFVKKGEYSEMFSKYRKSKYEEPETF